MLVVVVLLSSVIFTLASSEPWLSGRIPDSEGRVKSTRGKSCMANFFLSLQRFCCKSGLSAVCRRVGYAPPIARRPMFPTCLASSQCIMIRCTWRRRRRRRSRSTRLRPKFDSARGGAFTAADQDLAARHRRVKYLYGKSTAGHWSPIVQC